MERLFEKNRFTDDRGLVASFSEFKLFSGDYTPVIQERFHKGIIERAEKLLGKEYDIFYDATGEKYGKGSGLTVIEKQ